MKNLQEKNTPAYKISIAPMLDWTDRHFRAFLRLITTRALFYSEMVAAPAVILGNRAKLLDFDAGEQPLALQIGTNNPDLAKQCARFAADWGYDEINLNAGCPSSRVQSGAFGAVLMRNPQQAADCVAAMCAASKLPVTVKTRIALVEESDGFKALFTFADLMKQAGCARLIVHARRAKLNLSPKENRSSRLPIDYKTVYCLKQSFPDMPIVINGDVFSLEAAAAHLNHTDGVMIGRLAYGNPYALATVDSCFYGDSHAVLPRREILERFMPYLEKNQDKLSIICPHLSGLYHGCPNAKTYRQILAARDLAALKAFIKTAEL